MEHRMDTEPEIVPPPRGDYFAADDYLRTDVAAGVARDRAGTRLLALPGAFLTALDQTLAAECGPVRALRRAGAGLRRDGLPGGRAPVRHQPARAAGARQRRAAPAAGP